MQFSAVILAFAAMAGAVSAETVTVYACSTSAAASTSSGVASSTIASTGVVTAPTSTGSPIAYATGAASMNQVSFGAAVVAGAAALFL